MHILSRINTILRIIEKDFEPLNVIEISKKNILHNYDFLSKLTKSEVWPVLKSNAYGHGLNQVASILKEREFKYFVVDSYYEALKIHNICNREVLIIGSINPINFSKMRFKNIVITVQDIETIRELGKLAKKVKIHLKINTGMNRQGVKNNEELENILKLLKKYKNIELDGVFSHLADADNIDDSFTKKQEELFLGAIKKINEFGFYPKYIHLAATAGVKKIKNNICNAVRVGIGLYNGTLRFKSKITRINSLETGDEVSYNRTFKADKKMRFGVVPVGYYEGVDRRLSGRGWVKIKGKYCPIVGIICMNLMMVDLGEIETKIYDEVEIISNNSKDKNSIENMAKICQTIPYEILVKINESIRRKIV